MPNAANMMQAYAELDRLSIAGTPLTGQARTDFLDAAWRGDLVLEPSQAIKGYFQKRKMARNTRHGAGWNKAQAAVMTDRVKGTRGG
jgi:hypothetical protein